MRRRRRALAEEAEEVLDVAGPTSNHPALSNRSMGRLVAVMSTSTGGAALGDDLQPEPPAPVPADLGAASMGLAPITRIMEGHGFGPGSETSGSTPSAAPTSTGGVEVTVVFTANEATEEYKPGADIATAHGQEDAMGWTTPAYNILPRPGGTGAGGTIDVTLDFTVELAEEYQGRTLDVLREHEYGHVNLDTALGEGMLAGVLESRLEALPVVTPPAYNTVAREVAEGFEMWEGVVSWVYDRIDYPRMREAYLGARMTLDELVDLSSEVGTLAAALREFAALGEEPADLATASATVLTARNGLSDVDLARVQYNTEFEELVFAADETIARLLGVHSEGSTEEAQLRKVSTMMGAFSWEAPGSD